MLTDIPRETFLALCRIKSSTFDQRTRSGETALALGCVRTARPGWYLVLDVFAMILASIMNVQAGLQLKQAAEVVREEWTGWLDLITEVERWLEQNPTLDPMLCVAIAWLTLEPDQNERAYRILLGSHDDIARTLGGVPVYTCSFISIARVLHALRENARLAGIELPTRLTVAEDEPGYDNWRDEIAAYQERAGARVTKAKAPA